MRPVITYAFFLLFATVKTAALYVLIVDQGLTAAQALPQIWGPETQALFAAVMSFWFGQRTLAKGEASDMRHITQEGLDLIKRFEGFSPTIYICPAGYPTIGYGHVVRGDERDRFADGIDEEEASDLLQRDVRWAERGVLRLIDVPLTDGQFDALVSFTFNLGIGALQRSTLQRKVNREEHGQVPREFMR